MKVLITGNYGTFVSKLVEKFNKEGWEVYLLTGEQKSKKNYPHVFETYNFKYDGDSIKSIIDSVSPDILVFTGAYDESLTKEGTRQESMYYVSSLLNVLMASQMTEVPLFVYISSHEVFGESYLMPLDESVPVSPVTNRGILIAQGESLVERYGETTNLKTLILRVDHMYWTPKDKKDVQEIHTRLCLSAIKDKKVPASEKNIFSSIYISDVVYAIYEICTAGNRQHSLYQITSGEEENEMELAQIIKDASEGEIIIKDNTVGLTQRNVMSGERVEKEFGIRTRYSYKERTETILKYMNQHKKRFFSQDESEDNLPGRTWKRIQKTFWKLVPFLENIVVFLAVFMINNRTADVQFFQKVDIFLLYVVLFALFYGKQQAILSAVLSVGAYIFRQNYNRMGLDILIDFNTYVWVAQLFIVGMAVGHLKDSISIIKEDKDEEIAYLSSQLDDIHTINSSNLKVKNILEDHIRDYDNSLGMLVHIGEKIGKFNRGNIMVQAAEILTDVLRTEDVAIYKVSNKDYCRLLVSTTEKSRQYGKSLKYSELKDMNRALQKREVYLNRSLKENMPMMADGLYEDEKLKYIILLWNISFERISLHEMNLLQVIGYTIQNALEREDIYQSATREQRYLPDTNILNPDELEVLIRDEQEAREKDYREFSVLQVAERALEEGECVANRKEHLLFVENMLLKKLRDTDSIGLGRDGYLYILLSNTNEKEAQIVAGRLWDQGIACRLKEGI